MSDSHWFIVQTNPNCEKKAVAEIRRAGFRAYLPKVANGVRHHRTKQQIIKRRPLLTGYVFMRFPGPANWYVLRQCQGVKGVLYLDGRPYALPRADVAAIMREQRAMAHDNADARSYRMSKRRGERAQSMDRVVARDRFRANSAITTTSGPFERVMARVVRVTERGTVQAVANIFGIETSIEFTDLHNLELVDDDLEAA